MNNWFLHTEDKKMGLVLGGGGARGCYEIGVWQAMQQAGIYFNCVAGTSIGALVGAIYTQQTLDPIVDFVEELKPTAIASDLFAFPETLGELVKGRKQIRSFLDQYILSSTGMDISPLKEAISKMFDYEKFKNSPIDFACMTYNVTKHTPEAYFKSQMTEENAEDIILASASCYPAFPMLEMNGDNYIDGGYWDNVPVDLALKMGAEKIFAVDVEGPGIVRPLPKGVDVLLIKPMLPLGNFLDFTSKEGVRAMHAGYLETCKFLELYTGYLFTFTKEYLNDMYFIDSYLSFMFTVTGLKVEKGLPSWIVQTTVGFHPSSLSKMRDEDYKFGEMVEALAYSVKLDPVRLYDYHDFIIRLLEKLSEIRLDSTPSNAETTLEWLHSLSHEGLLAVFHKLIRDEDGVYRDYMNILKRVFTAEFYLAYVWYFLERAYERIQRK